MTTPPTDRFAFGGTAVDSAVLAHLPPSARIVATHPHGSSFWGSCGRIDYIADGLEESLFIKTTTNPLAPHMYASETASAHAIRCVVPDLVPRPIAWGAYDSSPTTYFYLAEFRPMTFQTDLPPPEKFAEKIAALHSGTSDKFGFELDTYNGTLPHDNTPQDSWQVFFAQSLRRALDHEEAARGKSVEVDALAAVVFDIVIPRLLGPLEGRIRPALVHGDLWFGNAATHKETGEPFVFDACCLYAHNEYELGQWKPTCNRFGKDYVDAYHRIIPKVEPVEDYDGRIDLYKLRFDTHVSALFADNPASREQVIGDMRDLVERYGQK